LLFHTTNYPINEYNLFQLVKIFKYLNTIIARRSSIWWVIWT